MRCAGCGFENRDAVRFCEECGANLELVCPACGAAIPPGRKFCGSCGQALSLATGPTSRFQSPDTYTPKHLAERILTSKAALEGERKQVTVLFADLKGSMELLADRDPEEARKILDPVLEHMMEAVHRYEGTVNQVMGDGIMALFGAPIAHEDHAVRACYAALRMQEAVKQYADGARRAHGVSVRIRVGLNSGDVVVRTISSDLHMDYTAVGQTTHLAARMEQLADPGSTLLTAATLKLAKGFVDVRALGPTPVRGLSEPVEIFEVTGAGTVRTRLQASAIRGLTAFIGRDSEIEQLHRALDSAAHGSGQVVAVVGEAGVGKSRLFYEFLRSHRLSGWLALESRSVSYGKATAYLPVIELLKSYFKIGDRDGQREVREKITGKLLTLDEALKWTLPALFALLDVSVDDPHWRNLDPLGRRQRTLDAVKGLLFRESETQPLVLVFEDLHWIDSETQALLDSLVEGLAISHILLLVNYRTEYQHGWSNKNYYTRLGIDSLPVETAGRLLTSLLGDEPGVQPLKALLIDRTEGNPFFLEECVRELVDARILVGARGAYRVARAVRDIEVPATVHGILAARIDRLPPEEKSLLQSASAVGKDVPVALLETIFDFPESRLRAVLAHLQAAEFLHETRLFPDLEYTFKHALTHDVVYRSLVSERRRLLHARLVDAIERLYLDRLAERTEELSHHAVHGELWDKALWYLGQAGRRALARSANLTAVTFFEQALAILPRLPETPALQEQTIDLRLELRTGLMPLGEFERTREVLRDAEAIAGRLDDRRRRGWIAGATANLLWEMGEQHSAVSSGELALNIALELGDDALRDLAYRYLGRSYHALGDHSRAIEALQHVVALRRDRSGEERPRGPLSGSLSPLVFLISCLTETGAFAEGIARGREALRAADAANRQLDLTATCAAVGRLYLRQGKLDESIAILERGLEMCQIVNAPLLLPVMASPLGAAYALAGRLSQALPLLREAVDRSIAMRRMIDQSLWLVWLSEALVRDGQLEEAQDLARRALELAKTYGERGNRAWTLRLLGEIYVRPNHRVADQALAGDYYRQALGLAEELGMRPLQAHCHLGLGLLHKLGGRPNDARRSLGAARQLLREMEMVFWLPQVESALAYSAGSETGV